MIDKRLRNLLLICLTSGAWSFGFGMGSQLVTHWLRARDQSETAIGLNHACHYLGLALASLGVPWLTRRLGTHTAALGMVVCGATLALFPWGDGPVTWFGLRLLNGAASALSLIPLEAMVSRDARPEQRTRDFGFYAVALTLGAAGGIWLGLDLYRPDSAMAFYLGAAPGVLSGVAVWRWVMPISAEAIEGSRPVTIQWSRHFLSFGTAWCQGFLEGGMLAFLSSYLTARGLSADLAGGMMGVTMVGVILFQVPVSWLADRRGRIPVLLGCYAITLAGLALVPYCPGTPTLALCLFAFGACSGAMYPLGLALLGEALPESSLARGYSWYMAMECAGSLMGAPAMGGARDLWGEGSMFAVGVAAVGVVLVGWIALRWKRATAAAAPATTPSEHPNAA